MILLTDIVSFYPIQSKEFVKIEYIKESLEIMVKYNNDGHLTQEIRYIKKQFGLWFGHYMSIMYINSWKKAYKFGYQILVEYER